MSRRLRKAAFACVAALVVAGLVACGSNDPDVVVLDSSVTQADPLEMEVNGLTGVFFFGVQDAYRFDAGYGQSQISGQRPVGYWNLKVPEGDAPKSFRAKVELLHDGEPVDAYYPVPGLGFGTLKNELVINDIERVDISGLYPHEAGPHGDGRGDEIASPTGDDFQFRLSEITVSDTPFALSHVIEKADPTVSVGTVTLRESERRSYCDSFARITPGMLETSADLEILADPGSTSAERQKALRRQVIPDLKRTHAYDCDLRSDEDLFAEYVQGAETK